MKQKARENRRYVDISILLKFNTLKALTTDEKVVAEAVKDSEVVEVNDSGSAIRRNAEMPDERNINKRRVFVDGLPQTQNGLRYETCFKHSERLDMFNCVETD